MKASTCVMRCAAGCGQIVRAADLPAVTKKCVERGGFRKIGTLYYCARCAAKRERVAPVGDPLMARVKASPVPQELATKVGLK